ncbi:hypothetical protein GCM10022295_78020 [Streptomyces osmaniensis]|uniref:Transposase n=1 Tax=Streptomyces osmaniensis TaxID=593134 RepID=A0ABP6YK27_9ACTN
MSLATHPLPVLRCCLAVHLSKGRLDRFTATGFGPALGIHPGDDSTKDCCGEGDYRRDDCPRCITHRAILARMLL